MSFFISLLASEGGLPTYETHSWWLPEMAEVIYGGISSVLVIGALVKFAGPMAKKSFADRTARIQSEIDSALAARQTAETEASQIRTALGDIQSERSRFMAEADAAAAALLSEGRARIAAEVAELESKADADIAAASGRINDELKGEIARLSSVAVDNIVRASLNDAVQQDLIEGFINNVGAAR